MATFSICLFLFSSSKAAINKQINYQGKLTNSDGTLVTDGSYNFKLAIYDASSGGTCLWSAKDTDADPTTVNCPSNVPAGAISIAISRGLFAILLGDASSGQNYLPETIFYNYSSVYLAVTVGADSEMTPRKRIGAVPQAFNANNLIGDGKINITGLPTGVGVGDGTVYVNPATANANETIFGAAVAGSQKLRLSSEGNLTLSGTVTMSSATITGLTSGSVTFAGSGGLLTQDNTNFYWDNTSKRLGIGTSTAQNRLDVSGGLAIGTYAGVNEAPTNGLIVSGAVGIGVSSPATALEVYGAATSTIQNATNFSEGFTVRKRGRTGDATGAVASGAELGYNDFWGWDGSAFAQGPYIVARATEDWTGSAHGSKISLSSVPAGTTAPVVRLTINDNGNVGLGNESPTLARLQIYDDTSIAGFAGLRVDQLGNAAGTTYGLYISKGGTSTTNIGGYFTAAGGTNNYALVTDQGNVGIGTPTPLAELDVNGLAVGNGFMSRHHRFREDFAKDRADVTADMNTWGDTQAIDFDEIGTITLSILDDTSNGISRCTQSAAGNGCNLGLAGPTAATNKNMIYNAANKPIGLFQTRASIIGVNNDMYVGFSDAQNNTLVVEPTNGAWFTNNDAGGATPWVGVIKSGVNRATVTCTGQNISTTQFALLRIDVLSTTQARFYVDPDISNGINMYDCGAATLAAGTLTTQMNFTLAYKVNTGGTGASTFDVDFFEISQDDPVTSSLPLDQAEQPTQDPLTSADIALADKTDSSISGTVMATDEKELLSKLLSSNLGLPEGLNRPVESELYADRIIAERELIASKITADQIFTRQISALPGQNLEMSADKNNKLSVKNHATGQELLALDSKGNLKTAGTLEADKIKANKIEGLELVVGNIDILQAGYAQLANRLDLLGEGLATGTPTPGGIVTGGSSQVVDLQVLGTLSNQGGLIVGGAAEFRNSVVFKAMAKYLGGVTFIGDVTFEGRPTFNKDTGGRAVIKAGDESVEVTFEKEYVEVPLINITATLPQPMDTASTTMELFKQTESEMLNNNLHFIVTDTSTKKFIIKINKVTANDIVFVWQALAVKNPGYTSSGNPTPTPISEPSLNTEENKSGP